METMPIYDSVVEDLAIDPDADHAGAPTEPPPAEQSASSSSPKSKNGTKGKDASASA